MSSREEPFEDHFSDRAVAYAAHRPTYPAELVDFLADVAPRRTLSWEAGCGSGQFSVALARRFERVVATDASPRQIALAAPHPRVEYHRARAGASGLPDSTVDLAAAAQAAHWFDLEEYYAEVQRVARTGSAVALIMYATLECDPQIDPVIGRYYSEVLGPYWPPERRDVEECYRTLPFPFRETAAPELEIRLDWRLADLLGYIESWSAVRALEKVTGGAATERFRSEIELAWGDPETPREVRWPLSLRVGHV